MNWKAKWFSSQVPALDWAKVSWELFIHFHKNDDALLLDCYSVITLMHIRHFWNITVLVFSALAHICYELGSQVILCGRKPEELQRVKQDLLHKQIVSCVGFLPFYHNSYIGSHKKVISLSSFFFFKKWCWRGLFFSFKRKLSVGRYFGCTSPSRKNKRGMQICSMFHQ